MSDNSIHTAATDNHNPLAIVGIGASAGGLEALERFFSTASADAGLAYIILQHVDRNGGDALPEVLGKRTLMPVSRIGESTRLSPNSVYVSPSHSTISCASGNITPVKLDDIAQRAAAVDLFFQSLAEMAKQRAIGIVLSGAGADGTLGLKAIADAGGMTIAQDAESARFDGMPGNAAATGVVDHVLRPEQMSGEIVAYAHHVASLQAPDAGLAIWEAVEGVLPKICNVLFQETQHDFKHYKSSTLIRRVLRRIQVRRLASAADYLKLIQEDHDEAHLLFRELLIGVTTFFRDPDTFATLAEVVLPKLFENRPVDEPVRVWVPGCATGEEAYTLAMLLREATAENDPAPDFQIFATDINERALNQARQAIYPLSIAEHLSEGRLKRFFVKRGGQYEVVKELRDRCTFSAHNLISDPPFSRLDLISCRNLLIYLGPHLQQKLIPVFHFSLRPGGYLLLGPSENLAEHTELFRPVDKKHRISQRKETSVKSGMLLPAQQRVRNVLPGNEDAKANGSDLQQISQSILLDEFAPRYVVVDENAHILCTSGNLDKYLALPEGVFQNNAVKLARSGLRGALRSGLHQARRTKRKVSHDELSVSCGDQVQRVQLVVQPMPSLGDEASLFMVVFKDLGDPVSPSADAATSATSDESLAEQLERELNRTRDELETTVQELERSNEELKSSNEELLSMNEELQTANEELETSKEEIQAGMEALDRSKSDLENLLHGTQIGTIFLDAVGNIISFTPAATEIYSIRPSDIGRPLHELSHNIQTMPPFPDGPSLAEAESSLEHELQDNRGRWFLRRVLPYQRDGKTDGTVVTFVDISTQKLAAARLAVEHDVTHLLAEADSFESVTGDILAAIRRGLNAKICNLWLPIEAADELYCAEVSLAEPATELEAFTTATQQSRFRVGEGVPGHVWETSRQYWIESVAGDRYFRRRDAAVTCGLTNGMAFPIFVGKKFCGAIEVYTSRLLKCEPPLVEMLNAVARDIGQFILGCQLDAKVRDREAQLRAIVEASSQMVWTATAEGLAVEDSPSWRAFTGQTYDEYKDFGWSTVLHPDDRDATLRAWESALKVSQPLEIEYRVRHNSGEWRWMSVRAVPQRNDNASIRRWVGMNIDITDRKAWELELSDREAHLRRVINNQLGLVGVIDRNGHLLEVDDQSLSIAGLNRDEVIGKHFAECGWWTYDPAVAQHMREAMEQAFAGERVRFDVPLYAAGDQRLMIDFMLAPVRAEDGTITHLIPSGVDISERVEAERIQRETTVRLEAVVSTAVDGIITIDAFGTINSANPAAAEVFGYSVAELIGNNVRMLMPEPFHSEHDSYLAAYRETGQQKIIGKKRELIGRRKDGTVFPLDLAVSETFLQGDHCYVGIVRDVTERKKSELTLQQTAERLTMAMKAGGLAAWEWSPSGSHWTDELYELLGIPKTRAACPETFFEIVHPDDLPHLQANWTKSMQGEQAYDQEFRILRPDGEVRWIVGVGEIVYDANGEVQRIFGLNWDSTQMHATAAALRESERRAHEASVSKSEFLANMSHEIRTPMTAVLGYTDLLAARESAPETLEYLRTIKRNGNFLLDIINDILDLSKIEAGKMELMPEQFALHNVIADVRSMMDVRAHEKNLRFEVACQGLIPATVESDPKRLKQILVNLLGNAIKFTEVGRRSPGN